MMCEECGQHPASALVVTDVNGKRNEMHLCQECMQKHTGIGFFHEFNEPSFTFHNILAGLFDPAGLMAQGQLQYKQKTRCPSCGLTFSDFRRLGQLGCSDCYKTFEAQLMPIIRRIHGSVEHTGKQASGNAVAAQNTRHLEELRQQLREAIAAEAYEKAAELRDEIKKLE